MLTMHLSQWTTNQETYMVTICTFIKSNKVATSSTFFFKIKWSFQGFPGDLLIDRAHPPQHLALVSVAGPLHSREPGPTNRLNTTGPKPQWGFCIVSKRWSSFKKKKQKKQKYMWRQIQQPAAQSLRTVRRSPGNSGVSLLYFCPRSKGRSQK